MEMILKIERSQVEGEVTLVIYNDFIFNLS